MWRRYLRLLGPRAEADVDEELRLHVEMRERDYRARGLTETEARTAAARRMGDFAAVRAACIALTTRRERRMTRVYLIDAFVQDIRFGLRTLGRQKGWTAASILTLALGIGATTAIFSIVSTLLLHPVAYPGADRIVVVYQQPTNGNNTGMSVRVTPQVGLLRAWRDGAHSFESIEGWATTDAVFQPPTGQARVLKSASILPSFATFAGSAPMLGRGFLPEDSAGARVALIGEGFWKSRFAADSGILHRTLNLDGVVYQVVGVMPASFQMPAVVQQITDVWLPLDLSERQSAGQARAHAEHLDHRAPAPRRLARIRRRRNGLDRSPRTTRERARRSSFQTVVVPPAALVQFGASLHFLTLAVALVLVIACANVAHLLLARGAARQRELSIRAALGAGTGRLRRQLLTESLVLSVAGCALGVAFGLLALRALIALRPEQLSQLDVAHLDATTLGVAMLLAVATGIVFGLVGSSQSRALAAPSGLRAGAIGACRAPRPGPPALGPRRDRGWRSPPPCSSRRRSWSDRRVAPADRPRLRPEGPVRDLGELPAAEYATPASRDAFTHELLARARGVPGVESITIGTPPPWRNFTIGALEIEGQAPPPPGATSFIDNNQVTPDYFAAMRIQLLQGSTFTDTSDAAAQVVINDGMARKFWPNTSAIGHRFRVVYSGQGTWRTIVGVAHNATTGGLLMDTSQPMFYLPGGTNSGTPIVRVQGPEVALPALRAIVRTIDPRLPPIELIGAERAMSDSIAGPRFTTMLLGIFTGLALVLAAMGLYGGDGVRGGAAHARDRIRIALGATRRRIARAVLGQGLTLCVVGVAIGLVAARLGGAVIRSMLSGVSTSDPLSFAVAAILMIGVTVLACVVPMGARHRGRTADRDARGVARPSPASGSPAAWRQKRSMSSGTPSDTRLQVSIGGNGRPTRNPASRMRSL